MKTSNLDRLLKRYVMTKTPKPITAKIEAMFEAMKKGGIRHVAEETDELLYQKIIKDDVTEAEIQSFIGSFTFVTVPGMPWIKQPPYKLHFSISQSNN
jgi:hypothetical protein